MNLLILIFFPLVASLIVLVNKRYAKQTALITSLVSLAIAALLFSGFTADASRQFEVSYPWIASMGINFAVALDGISMLMVLLTTGLFPLIILSSFNRSEIRSSSFYAL